MPTFSYIALNRSGQRSAGVIDAAGRTVAIRQLADQGLHPVELNEKHSEKDPAGAWRGKLPRSAVEAFTRELANLLTAGVSLSRSLNILAKEASHPAARKSWAHLRDDVMDGSALADAMSRLPAAFTDVNVAMVRAGETGGFLNVVLEQIADFRERERDLTGKIAAAMIYPAILCTLLVLVVVFLLIYFIPKFELIFDDFGQALPPLTKAIVTTSEILMSYGPVVLVAGVLAVVALHRAAASEAGKRHIEWAMLRLPGVGTVVSRLALVRFCRMLGTLIGAGVPLVSALRVARQALGNQILSDAVTQAIEQVQSGQPLAQSLGQCPALFPASVVEMVTVAEETGRLETELVRLAGNYEQDLDRHLRMLMAALEPALLFVMAAVVGTIVVGMLLPIFTLQDMIR